MCTSATLLIFSKYDGSVRETKKLSGKSQIILLGLIDRRPEVILIEVVDSTTSPPNSIALKSKILCHRPHTNSCICFLISVTNLVQPVANFYCLHSTGSVIGAIGSC